MNDKRHEREVQTMIVTVECPDCGFRFYTGDVGDYRGCWKCDHTFETFDNIVENDVDPNHEMAKAAAFDAIKDYLSENTGASVEYPAFEREFKRELMAQGGRE